MKKTKRHCQNCTPNYNGKTEHKELGLVPQQMFENSNSVSWVRASVCSECGLLHSHNISDQEMDWAERRLMRALVDTGNISEQEAREILDGK